MQRKNLVIIGASPKLFAVDRCGAMQQESRFLDTWNKVGVTEALAVVEYRNHEWLNAK